MGQRFPIETNGEINTMLGRVINNPGTYDRSLIHAIMAQEIMKYLINEETINDKMPQAIKTTEELVTMLEERINYCGTNETNRKNAIRALKFIEDLAASATTNNFDVANAPLVITTTEESLLKEINSPANYLPKRIAMILELTWSRYLSNMADTSYSKDNNPKK